MHTCTFLDFTRLLLLRVYWYDAFVYIIFNRTTESPFIMSKSLADLSHSTCICWDILLHCYAQGHNKRDTGIYFMDFFVMYHNKGEKPSWNTDHLLKWHLNINIIPPTCSGNRDGKKKIWQLLKEFKLKLGAM